MKDYLIPNWTKAWQFYTMWINLIAILVGVGAGFLTQDWQSLILSLFGVLNALFRIIAQPRIHNDT